MQYYYLKGIEKVGPFSVDDLPKDEINDDTLFWYEGISNWTKLKDLPELRKFFFEEEIIPPPIPEEILKKIEKEKVIEVKQEKKKTSRNAIKWVLSLIILGISIFVPINMVENQISEKENEIISNINLILQGKNAACDGEKYFVKGELNKIRKPKKLLKKDEENFVNILYDNELIEYNQKKEEGIVEEFTLESGGFSIYKIVREDNGYVIINTTATNMVYTVGQYEYHNNGYGGYKSPSFRPSVEECYLGAFNYLTIKDKEGCYTPNSYNQIKNFYLKGNDYFEINNVRKPTYHFAEHWRSDEGGQIYTKQYKVKYKTDSKYYEIKEVKSAANELYAKYIGLGLLIGFLLIGGMIWLLNTLK